MRRLFPLLLASVFLLGAQQPPNTPQQAGQVATNGPVTLSLQDALTRARAYSQQFQSAVIAAATSHEALVQARAAFFPTLNYFNQYIYTQGNGTPTGIFVAANGVHVYNSQAVVHGELFSLTQRAEYRQAMFAQAAAQAKQEIAARGLVSTVVGAYYGLIAAQRHLVNARLTLDEARRFLDITQKQEAGGEVAHADVVKAQLNLEQRTRDLQDAELNVEKARIALGVMLFPDINQQFDLTDDLAATDQLPNVDEMRTAAQMHSPDVRAAQASLKAANFGVSAAKGAFYPSLVYDYFFGIDANQFAVHGPEGQNNLGSSAQASLTIPVWNWGAMRSKVRQAELQRRQAQVDLTFAQRNLESTINSAYLEAQAARAQLDSLRRSVDLSAESLRLTILRYQAGEATALEVSDAQSTLAQARNAYDDGLTRYRVALVGVRILTGTL